MARQFQGWLNFNEENKSSFNTFSWNWYSALLLFFFKKWTVFKINIISKINKFRVAVNYPRCLFQTSNDLFLLLMSVFKVRFHFQALFVLEVLRNGGITWVSFIWIDKKNRLHSSFFIMLLICDWTHFKRYHGTTLLRNFALRNFV